MDLDDLIILSNIIQKIPNIEVISMLEIYIFTTFALDISQSLNNLYSLDLSKTCLTVETSFELVILFESTPNLSQLILRKVALYEDTLYPIIEYIPNMKSLSLFDISYNMLSQNEVDLLDEIMLNKQDILQIYYQKINNIKKYYLEYSTSEDKTVVELLLSLHRNIQSYNTFEQLLQAIPTTVNSLVISMEYLTNKILEYISKIPNIKHSIGIIKFTHLFSCPTFSSDSLLNILNLLDSEIISSAIFQVYCINRNSIFFTVSNQYNQYRDINFNENLMKLSNYIDAHNLNRMIGKNNSLFIDDSRYTSKLILNRLSSIPHIHSLFMRSIFPIFMIINIRLFIK